MLNKDQIIGSLRSKGLTVTETAKLIGVSKQAVSQTINRKNTSCRIQNKIAEILGLSFRTIWVNNSSKNG